MNELALFAGAGGGILGGHLLGWRTVCAVEWEAYPASVLCARQNDGLLPPFPIWDDVQTFDGKPWRGIVDVVSGGFPCQDISAAGGGLASKEKEAECGDKWQGSFTKYDPNSCSWKTHQCLLVGDLDEFSETWPQWGLMQDGECWEQIPLDLPTTEPEFGWLPTPIATDWKGGCSAIRKDKGKPRTDSIRMYIKTKFDITYPHPNFLEALMDWPLGWTELKPLVTDKFPCVQQQHGES